MAGEAPQEVEPPPALPLHRGRGRDRRRQGDGAVVEHLDAQPRFLLGDGRVGVPQQPHRVVSGELGGVGGVHAAILWPWGFERLRRSGSAGSGRSFSGEPHQECIEVAAGPHSLLLRESDDPAAVLATRPARVAALLSAIKGGGWTSRR
ncbi:DUF397 domain-containing protein [Streptomyces millisiae]|uniref:DUF397 domain-containing protein n=1 Tax=Streptomyces millisiae TaxID=3075542 RepID=A0ABU2LP85_9ACTN|nr:DUF397 domain-containing protein [Streptomyces sp. DSM 44918]MDT0319414.1 DUF397 domain-containing protein [Streptomyces sp. DSM 44918]